MSLFGNRTFRATIAVTLGLAASAGAQAQSIDEYQVKAAFLLNFAKFVEWPAQTFRSANDPITVCVLGSSPFGHSLDDAVDGKSVDGRRFVVRKTTEIGQIAGCQILFIAACQRKQSPDIAIPGILTVGECEGFAARHGVIGFKLENGRVRLEINVDAAEQRKLRVSSKLLSLAQIVKTQEPSR